MERLISRFPPFQLSQKIQERAPENLYVRGANPNQADCFELVSHHIELCGEWFTTVTTVIFRLSASGEIRLRGRARNF